MGAETLQKAIAKNNFAVYGLENGTEVTLCKTCHLEEVISNMGGLLDELGIRKEEAEFGVRLLDHVEACITKNKYCTECAQRFLLLKAVVSAAKS